MAQMESNGQSNTKNFQNVVAVLDSLKSGTGIPNLEKEKSTVEAINSYWDHTELVELSKEVAKVSAVESLIKNGLNPNRFLACCYKDKETCK